MNNKYVLDCSVAMAWLFDDERNQDVLSLREQLIDGDALVPALWPIEVANVLRMAEKKQRITVYQSSQFKRLLKQLPINLDNRTPELALNRLLELAREYDLTVYDAAYLELALRCSLPLATLDSDLRHAAEKAGMPTLPG